MEYCRSLDFKKVPNYAFLRRLFCDTMAKYQFENDAIFDWTIQRYLKGETKTPTFEPRAHDCLSSLPDSLKGQFFGGSEVALHGDLLPSSEEEKWATEQEEQ